jgi:hypothetical protein
MAVAVRDFKLLGIIINRLGFESCEKSKMGNLGLYGCSVILTKKSIQHVKINGHFGSGTQCPKWGAFSNKGGPGEKVDCW